jgi:hypothetical protein
MNLLYVIYRPETLNVSLGCVYEYEPSVHARFSLPAERDALQAFLKRHEDEAKYKDWLKPLQITIIADGHVLRRGSDEWIDAQGVLGGCYETV